LQEWCGYLLTPDISQQKILLMLGPRRSGKGTISRTIQALVGKANCCGPTLNGLAGPFGLAPLLGKSVAAIEDARLSPKSDIATIIERLLAISGGGTMTVDRKQIGSVDACLSVRFVVSTNEILKLVDTSGAMASRWCVLRFEESFAGREDTGLADRLLTELPGIFLWAVAGWARLTENERFTTPENSKDAIETIEESGSPIGTFVKEKCSVAKKNKISCEKLYKEWTGYCVETGKKEPGDKREFGRLLRASVPGLKRDNYKGEKHYYGIDLIDLNESQSQDELAWESSKEHANLGQNSSGQTGIEL